MNTENAELQSKFQEMKRLSDKSSRLASIHFQVALELRDNPDSQLDVARESIEDALRDARDAARHYREEHMIPVWQDFLNSDCTSDEQYMRKNGIVAM